MNADMASIAQLASQIPQSQPHPYPPPQQAQQGSPAPSGSGTKRKSEDGQQGGQQRAKRNRYISIACNECKRRKIKCNGQAPCQRCGNLNLVCVYAPNCCNGFKDSQEFREMSSHMQSLQDQVTMLWDNLNALRAQMGHTAPMAQQQPQQHATPIDPSLQSQQYMPQHGSFSGPQASPGAPIAPMSPIAGRPKSQSQQHQQPTFRGPTSNDFNFDVARSSLQTMGITAQDGNTENGSGDAGFGTREASPLDDRSNARNMQFLPDVHRDKDPIWTVSQGEALRLCKAYEDDLGLMYPVLDINKVIAHATKLYSFMEAAHRTGLMQQGMPGADAIDDEDTNILKIVLATSLTVEASGRSDLGQRMFNDVQPAIKNAMLGNVGIKGIKLLTMTAMYEFHRDNEGASWRIIGLTARTCVELGLHRRETYEAMTDEAERSETILLFWAIYVLDRRWSFGTGMPFALQDADIDPLLPKPEDRSPYLSAMIKYSEIGSKVWRTVAATPSPADGTGTINTEEMNYLDYQVIQWHRSIPAHLRFEHPSQRNSLSTAVGPAPSRAANRLCIILYLRANQMRIHIYRPVLHSVTSIMQHRKQAQTVVDVATDTTRVLTHINQTSDLYRTHQVLFNAFLTSALAVLFLAVSHTPAIFAEDVREEFYMALELVRGFSKGSFVSKRLWKTIRVLKEVAPKLGLADKPSPHRHGSSEDKSEIDPSRSAAVAMAGLAGHNVDEMALFHGTPQAWAAGGSGARTSPDDMANDLTSLFEAAGSFQALVNRSNGDLQEQYPAQGVEGAEMVWREDEGLSHILKELF